MTLVHQKSFTGSATLRLEHSAATESPPGLSLVDLNDQYRSLEAKFPIFDKPDWGQLVVPNGNAQKPIHRWFHLKEAFSCDLLAKVLCDMEIGGRADLRILDPFVGVGTTVVSAANLLSAATIRGVECNPFLHLVSTAKLSSLRNPPQGLAKLGRKIAATAERSADVPPRPALSTFRNEAYFDSVQLTRLLLLRQAIEGEEKAGADPHLIRLCRVALGAVVEPVSRLRRDGRTLRHVPDKAQRTTAIQGFLDKLHQIASDIPAVPARISGRIDLADGRRLGSVLGTRDKFDLVLFSPPYPNNIDYTEVYKLENWLLGLIGSSQDFAAQRLRTVYSHPSLLREWNGSNAEISQMEDRALKRLCDPLCNALPEDRYRSARQRMFHGYVHDMYLTLRGAREVLHKDGALVYIVGNSVHGIGSHRVVVAADLLIAELAEMLNFDVARINVARRPGRRRCDSPYLRESIVLLRVGR